MSWHSRPRPECHPGASLEEKVNLLLELTYLNIEGLELLMSAVQVEQADIDALAANLSAAVAAVASEIADLEAKVAADVPLPAGSLDGLNAALSSLQALEVPAPAPVEPAPTPEPAPEPAPDTASS